MRRIDREYAIIYIDDGETLDDRQNERFCHPDIPEFYYTIPGFLQWNFYLIVPTELVPDKETAEEFISDDKYCRKYLVPRDKIDEWIELSITISTRC